MAARRAPDELGNEIEELVPRPVQSSQGGRKRVGNRTAFNCIVFLLKTGIGYRDFPTELGASEKTVRLRLKRRDEIGQWDAIYERLLAKLRRAGRLDPAEGLIDGELLQAPCGGEKSGRTRRIADVAAVS